VLWFKRERINRRFFLISAKGRGAEGEGLPFSWRCGRGRIASFLHGWRSNFLPAKGGNRIFVIRGGGRSALFSPSFL